MAASQDVHDISVEVTESYNADRKSSLRIPLINYLCKVVCSGFRGLRLCTADVHLGSPEIWTGGHRRSVLKDQIQKRTRNAVLVNAPICNWPR